MSRPRATAPAAPAAAPGRVFGYARVSRGEQNLDHQLDQLAAAGVPAEQVFTDTASGTLAKRAGLDELLRSVEPEDVIVVVRLDRLGRSLAHLVALVAELTERGVGVRALAQPIDTTIQGGSGMVGLFAWLAETERAYLVERTRDGLTAAAARGRRGGRPTVMDAERIAAAHRLLGTGLTPAAAARALGVGRSTFYRHVRPPAA